LYLNSSNALPAGCEVTLDMVQAMTHDLRQQTLSLQEERERLVSAQRELGKLQQELPFRKKKTNTQVRGEQFEGVHTWLPWACLPTYTSLLTIVQ
jgi:hypothetical protein